VPSGTEIPDAQRVLSRENWLQLLTLAHVDRGVAFQRYSEYYQSTSGQLYWSDTHQLSEYIDDYHQVVRAELGEKASGTEMITEIYVPRADLAAFLEDVRADFMRNQVDLIYGTVRLIERDPISFMPWAREPWACVIFNLHSQHDAEALARTEGDFRRLIDHALDYGGSYFPTYHRWATRQQVLACHPKLPELITRKRELDPEERFQSEWYRHYRAMFGV
jgi:hypothetical protein